ncbi:ComEA family DNA-binding protein [Montanilutibacter psychrotolerans]|uniref:ComEA family DNA-binding protein n=1 Tax=Montanilutibacter psychrotolerans TaxID=1327343 RepID=A0A3M8SXN4_9GAMM|nr:ComEA family DNA-binding protein [Lysobacter psychrotolerans]RNF86077.1 ComEA family DNA-binding protein [Lysobacter psychrotolerans]
MKSFDSLVKSLAFSLLLAVSVLPGGASAADRVNINTADAATLDEVLINVGPSKAEAIVAYRKEHGAFRSVEELALVTGIGLRTVEKNRDRIDLGNVPAARPTARPTAAGSAPAPGRAAPRRAAAPAPAASR